MLTNYHTHCFRCQHAEGSVEDYVTEAITRQFDKLGMSDHVPYPHYDYGLRMPMSEIWDYIYEVREAQEKYKDRIQVLLGFESEYLCTQRAYYEELLTDWTFILFHYQFLTTNIFMVILLRISFL